MLTSAVFTTRIVNVPDVNNAWWARTKSPTLGPSYVWQSHQQTYDRY